MSRCSPKWQSDGCWARRSSASAKTPASYPTPLVGWAGWDHLQCAQALATTYERRRSVDGWSPEQLKPILAGLAELVPWLRQWHNDVDQATGLRLGDFFAEFVATESAANGFGTDDLAAWQPPARTVGRRSKRPAGGGR